MRYLNKIVFINSANIKYAEINLDGNVHFIGTQGVGKSTILRAILFFYNANKQRLGIRTQQGQKPFDDSIAPIKGSSSLMGKAMQAMSGERSVRILESVSSKVILSAPSSSTSTSSMATTRPSAVS